MINTRMLDEKIALMERQKEEHFAVYHQALGAIGILQHLKDCLGTKDHLTTEEFGQMMGGNVESIDPV